MRASARHRSVRRLLGKLAFSTLATLIGFEGSLWFFLESDRAAESFVARRLRNPAFWAGPSNRDLYWQLAHEWRTAEVPLHSPPYDPLLGWTWWNIEPNSYAHRDEAKIAGRRPVLLFGDSFSAGVLPAEFLFQNLLERSALAPRYALLNYGVCGYGFDQTVLLAEAALRRHRDRDPVVVIGVLVDDDLDRAMLHLREFPKPRFELVDGTLVRPEFPVPAVDDFARATPDVPRLWTWQLLRRKVGEKLLGRKIPPLREDVLALERALTESIVATLEEARVPCFFLLFHSQRATEPGVPRDDRDQLLARILDAHGILHLEVRDAIRARALEESRPIGDYFLAPGEEGAGHHDEAGNRVAFEVLTRGIEAVMAANEGR